MVEEPLLASGEFNPYRLTDEKIFDPITAARFVEDNRKALSMDEPYVFFEDALDAAGNPRQFQTTKLKFIDETGRPCLLGMSLDVLAWVLNKYI